MNYIIFDQYDSFKTGEFLRLSTAAKEDGTDVDHERLAFDGITITEPGFIYIYLSNENETEVDVYFDDFKVTHTKGPIVSSQDYYPFGLTFNSYQRENSTPNQYKFNGIEEQDELDLNVYGAFFRTMDPTIGRWWQIDPKVDNYYDLSPYNAMGNNPISIKDPLGDDWETDNDQRKAEKFDRTLQKTEAKLQRKENKLTSKIAKATRAGNTDRVAKLTANRNDLSARRNEVSNARTELAALGNDHRVDYSFAQSDRSYGYLSRGRNDADGKINITINTLSGKGNLSHELKHAHQYSTQRIHMFEGSDQVRFTQGLSPIDSEIQAYQRQYGVAGAVPTSDSDHNSRTPDANATRMNQIDANHVRGIYSTDDSDNRVFLYNGTIYH